MDNRRVNYLNWVPLRILYFIVAVLAISLFLAISSFMKFNVFHDSKETALWSIRFISLAFSIICIYFLVVLGKARRSFSYTGGMISDKILKYVLNLLKWDGKGNLLDIGCGSGALSIKCAKKYSESKIIGIDYWGTGWDYNKKQCEINAKAEGVYNITFKKGDAANLQFGSESIDAAVSNFVFHDLFFNEKYYGKERDLRKFLNNLGLKEIHLESTENLEFIPRSLINPVLLKGIGIIYGVK